MKHAVIVTFSALAAACALVIACSSDSSGGPSSAADAGTTSATTSGGGSTSSSGDTPTPTDTCRPAGGTCQCSCGITGQTLDTTKSCIQPSAGSGECHKVCCTGAIDSGASSTSSSSGSSGISDSGTD